MLYSMTLHLDRVNNNCDGSEIKIMLTGSS